MEWEKRSEKSLQVGYRRMLTRTYTLPNGDVADFTIKQESGSVCILALTEKNEVILARQFRPGPERILLELPGGRIEAGETPDQAAARELLEETGYTGDVRFVTTCWDCAYSTLQRSCFVATNCVKIAEQKLDPQEYIEIVLLSLKEFRALLQHGDCTDVEVGYLGLDALGLL